MILFVVPISGTRRGRDSFVLQYNHLFYGLVRHARLLARIILTLCINVLGYVLDKDDRWFVRQ